MGGKTLYEISNDIAIILFLELFYHVSELEDQTSYVKIAICLRIFPETLFFLDLTGKV